MADIREGILLLNRPLQSKRGVSADLAHSEYVAASGELIVATDTGEMRYGDGVNSWSGLKTCDNTRIANNLETVDSGEVLDAAQGMVLNNRLIALEGIRGIDCGEIDFYISIDRDETQPIMDFYYYRYAGLSFTATYLAPSGLGESSSPSWTAEGLPEGLTAESSNGVLTISGYAQEECIKDVTISVSLGECSDTKIFTFQVAKDGNAVEISNSDLGDWGIGVAGSVTLTSNTTGSVSGTAKYYSTSKPSWMSLNSSTGVLSGTATGSAGSGNVSVYVIKGNYKSLTKSLSYRTVNTLPQWNYSRIDLDVTGIVRGYREDTQTTLSLAGLYISSGDTTFSLSTSEVIKHGAYTRLSLFINNNKLYMTRINGNGNNTIHAAASTCILTAANAYGSSSIELHFYAADKAIYKANSSKYSSHTPIVTYS